MKHAVELFFRIALLMFIWFIWLWVINQPLSNIMNLSIIVGGVLLVFPLVWLGRMILDRQPTTSRAAWIFILFYPWYLLIGLRVRPVYRPAAAETGFDKRGKMIGKRGRTGMTFLPVMNEMDSRVS
jgi:hypothetical protein